MLHLNSKDVLKVSQQKPDAKDKESDVREDDRDEREEKSAEKEEDACFREIDNANHSLVKLDGIKKELESKQAYIESQFFELKKLEGDLARIAIFEIEKQKDCINWEKRLNERENELNKKSDKLDERECDLERKDERLKSVKEVLEEREANLNAEVKKKVIDQEQYFKEKESDLNERILRLQESLKTSTALVSNFEDLQHKLGDEDPETVLLKLENYEKSIKKLRDDLATRPPKTIIKAYERLEEENKSLEKDRDRLLDENSRLIKKHREQLAYESKIEDLEQDNNSYKRRLDSANAENERLIGELKRLQSAYERDQEREARIRDIETPYIQKELPRRGAKNEVDEIQWLEGILDSCAEYGLKFSKRILYAFHTALKTSEWSPITVLAGVSGTGKSELPRLYSHFGGINFLSLSVQPNWDSPESMLGFFNSIDNKFDAQPVLRLLAQSQKGITEDYPYGLRDVMNLILLDEMNLAHVEFYFAEFLSKLELRRGKDDVPKLEVKLGAGIQPYDLPLGRNVLWVGTMNQDETTKSLSDKVLDRGIVINFPRPKRLERRRALKMLKEPAPLLSCKRWHKWRCNESKFADEDISRFKSFIEDMNENLSQVGRALGHRVWQSIEYYMANYPSVLEAQRNNDKNNDKTILKNAMKIAFEDQLVQKVMPKLRGIETRGESKTKCLDKIRKQLEDDDYKILEDFDNACNFGHGQFMWNTANYLIDKGDELIQNGAESELDLSKQHDSNSVTSSSQD